MIDGTTMATASYTNSDDLSTLAYSNGTSLVAAS
jgi:hypothetical protein